ncbi:hypothetical protein SAMD00019534_062250 [Acytostelium subglobosum LB1]|uniref:hypothetical protein n=1 Tax=Acytostelium subglobosum LB1 TaxID=1410327 RepID=UPI0006451C32|nr:hypothetical protein SAMD00019534_062250 [Acytostelium subglobosum LB1]GAM23050.1 hypothetical protein SAMD00019534_062250 [Acytostelium subglobosum LB1]|eukprot:XP_012754277.1 hypothetical protein SAMD00019534_062250 [Acytostelium subglobosum LB1]
MNSLRNLDYPLQNLSSNQLDKSDSIGYTYKCMASGVWGLRSSLPFRETLDQLIKQGGDADTNGAVCGAMIGCKIGYSQLPKDMLDALPNKKWLDNLVVQFINKVVLNPNQSTDLEQQILKEEDTTSPSSCIIS